jgi:uncharacterized protein
MSILFTAALAGLIATPHCVGMCGGFAAACARPRRGMSAWHAGRLLTYALLGAAAGAFGGVLPGPAWLPAAVAAALLVWFAASLAGLLPQRLGGLTQGAPRLTPLTRTAQRLARTPAVPHRLLFGTVTGLLPCGMVYAALSLAVAAAHPLAGALAMLAFGAATVPGLTVLSLGVQRIALRGLWHRRALAALVLVVGLWSVTLRATASAHTTSSHHPTSSSHTTSSHHPTSSSHTTSSDPTTSSDHTTSSPTDPARLRLTR